MKPVQDSRFPFLVGIDGGGTGTRAVIARRDAPTVELARGEAGPSGLALGIDQAWQAIEAATTRAFAAAGHALDWSACVVGCGLAGVNHRRWRSAFIAMAPASLPVLAVESDAYTTLLGAHGGAPGVVIALGTGSIGLGLGIDGRMRMAGGFGFPSGDEASGAWLGLHAIGHAQRAVDARGPCDAFARDLLAAAGVRLEDGLATQDEAAERMREALLDWVVGASQSDYASLAPVIAAHAVHPVAAALFARAGREVDAMVAALDPHGHLPLALCGGLAPVIAPFIAPVHAPRRTPARHDAAHGALMVAWRAASDV
ncbi:ATPase [Robbsia sp. Bb-Pol-6]|uniref:ATPase n=1 Tax=Robbsia betulipollinis TaxID=2981849 RepID=A0ABT3ZS45_9BURK|nr:BadF/BadG/BcrA/BcrD ATPase family protein [Robbsia betulipollinis]MCY0389102.1 ATPase [Robbsia betulipollinis]